MIRVNALLAAALVVACGQSDEAPSCPSGVRLNGQCLVASDGGGVPDATTGPSPGAECDEPAVLACAAESLDVLSCPSGRYERVAVCAADAPCVELPGRTSVHCGIGELAQPIALADAPCAAPGAASCSPDRASLLSCDAGVWRVLEACAAKLACGRTPANTKGPGWSCPGPSACAVCK